MAWRRPGDKPLSESMMVSLLTHMCATQHQLVSYCGIIKSSLKQIQCQFHYLANYSNEEHANNRNNMRNIMPLKWLYDECDLVLNQTLKKA